MMTKMKVTKTMTEEEYMAKVADIKKQHRTQEVLNKVAEQHMARRRPLDPVQRTQPRRTVPRYVQPQPIRGLLAPEPTQNGFMSLLNTTPDGSKG